MLIFINSNGEVVGTTPLGITQGSSKANTLQLVCPFPNAIVSVSFQLPNGIVLGPYLEDDYGAPANEYVMQKAFTIPGYGVEGSELTVYTYTCNKEISALPGKLGVQFFVHFGEVVKVEEKEANEYGGYTLAVELIQIPIYNGTKFIPNPAFSSNIPEVDTWDEVLELLSGLRTDIGNTSSDLSNLENNAVLKEPEDTNTAQIIKSAITITRNLIVSWGINTPNFSAQNGSFQSYLYALMGKIGTLTIEKDGANSGYIQFSVKNSANAADVKITPEISHDSATDSDYVSGLQINGRITFAGNVICFGDMSIEGDLSVFGTAKILLDPTAPEDAANKGYVDTAISNVMTAINGIEETLIEINNGGIV